LNHKKGLTIVALILLAIFCLLLSLVPIENLFITFGFPQSVFCYANTGTLLDVVDGDNSCMIICRTSGNALVLFIHPKTADGYKIGTYWMREDVYSEHIEPFAISVYRFKGSRDYYITASGITTDDNLTV
jgi:hypothetical protein